jgi:hypothetical protein
MYLVRSRFWGTLFNDALFLTTEQRNCRFGGSATTEKGDEAKCLLKEGSLDNVGKAAAAASAVAAAASVVGAVASAAVVAAAEAGASAVAVSVETAVNPSR